MKRPDTELHDVPCATCSKPIPVRTTEHGWTSLVKATGWYHARVRDDGAIGIRIVCSVRCRDDVGPPKEVPQVTLRGLLAELYEHASTACDRCAAYAEPVPDCEICGGSGTNQAAAEALEAARVALIASGMVERTPDGDPSATGGSSN